MTMTPLEERLRPVGIRPPAEDWITVVAGSGRCGTSLVMQMLDAAGVPCIGDYPGFENDGFQAAWTAAPSAIEQARGKAVKLLCPMLSEQTYPQVANVAWLWVTRDVDAQTDSQVKFMQLMFPETVGRITKKHRAGIRRQIEAEYATMHRLIAETPTHRVKDISFEWLLANAQGAAFEITEAIPFFLETVMPITTIRMAQVVVARGPECYDGFLETVLIEAHRFGVEPALMLRRIKEVRADAD